MVVVLVVILWVLCAGVTALIAQARGLDVGKFAVAGLVLGVIGVLWAAFADDRPRGRPREGVTRRPAVEPGEERPSRLGAVKPLDWRD